MHPMIWLNRRDPLALARGTQPLVYLCNVLRLVILCCRQISIVDVYSFFESICLIAFRRCL